jgi:hypothetical protein
MLHFVLHKSSAHQRKGKVSDESPRVEFSVNNGIIEIRYFDTPKDELYRSWKLPG